MCITFIARGVHSTEKFILAFNREEFFSRETHPIGFHCTDSNYKDILFYPLDITSLGTFLCLNILNGNFCTLLNHPTEKHPYDPTVKKKRAEIPLNFCKLDLIDDDSVEIFFNEIQENKDNYNGFNVLCGNILTGVVYYYSNSDESIEKPIKVQDDVIVLSNNSLLDQNSIYNPRIEYTKKLIMTHIPSCENAFEEVLAIMNNDYKTLSFDITPEMLNKKSTNEILKDTNLKSYLVSSIFMKDQIGEQLMEYGTRHTICLTFDDNKKLSIIEICDEIYSDDGKLRVRDRQGDSAINSYFFYF